MSFKLSRKKYYLIILTFFIMLILSTPTLKLNSNVFASFSINSTEIEPTHLICDTITLEPITSTNRSDIHKQLVNILLKYDEQTAKLLDFNVAGKFTVDTAEKMISSKDQDAAFSHSYCIHSNDNIKNIIGNISATFYTNDRNSNNNN